jgi:hypothetical protein
MPLIASGTMQTDDAPQFYHAELSAEAECMCLMLGSSSVSHVQPMDFEDSKWFFRNATSVRYSHAPTCDGSLK